MIKGFAHICFTVSDLDSDIAFYQDKLGFRHAFDFINDQGKRYGVYLHIGGRCFIELFQGVEVTPVKRGNDQSWQVGLADLDGNRIELHACTEQSKQQASLK
jgi:catechol 2,3-dioxygenase-like lactoylglutathione lyase family enzyme